MEDEYRVEITVRVVPRDTARKIGRAQDEIEFAYSSFTSDEAAKLIALFAKVYEEAFEGTKK